MTEERSTNAADSNGVLITGGDRGLGLGFVRHYLEQGYRVIATSRRPRVGDLLAESLGQYPDQLRTMSLDVGDETSIAEFSQAIKGHEISFHLVISNAGVTVEESFGQWTTAAFTTNFRVNTVGPALLVQALKPFLQGGAKIVQVSSGMGSIEWNIEPENGLDAYAVSKCGLNILTRRLAEKLRSSGISVLSMNPGWVRTDMGGKEAPTTVDVAVKEMAATIDGISMQNTGSFVARDGSVIPW